MIQQCEYCSTTLEYFRYGSSLVVRCPNPECTFDEAATTYPLPIWSDANRYRVIITPSGELPAKALVALNQRFDHGIVVTRRMFASGENELTQGSAFDIWNEAQRLRTEGIPFRIEPEFPFDLDNPDSAFGPPDGQIPPPVFPG